MPRRPARPCFEELEERIVLLGHGMEHDISTTTRLSISGTPTYGGTLTLNAHVSNSPGGSVQFFSGSTSLGIVSLASGGSITVSASTPGTHSFSATFLGWIAQVSSNSFNVYESSSGFASETTAPAPLVVTANDATRVVGGPAPAPSASYAGFVDGEGPQVLGGALAVTDTTSISAPPGTYADALVSSGLERFLVDCSD